MTDEQMEYTSEEVDADWGSSFAEVSQDSLLDKIHVCHVNIFDLERIAAELATSVLDESWMMSLDDGARRAYRRTVEQTARKLIEVFENNRTVEADGEDKVTAEFGEIMVSMSSSRSLEVLFEHNSLPISELWKPKLTGNEGFDFHTVCPSDLVNFGEAKFSSSRNPYGGDTGDTHGAAGQADGFFLEEKHLRDRVYLVDLVDGQKIQNLDDDKFGAIVSFSMNAANPLNVFSNAVSHAVTLPNLANAEKIYVVGVSYDG